jgi:hypothetical protein
VRLLGLTQAAAGLVLRLRRRVPTPVAGLSIGLLFIVFLEVSLGSTNRHWLHVQVGVGIISWLWWLMGKLNSVDRALPPQEI